LTSPRWHGPLIYKVLVRLSNSLYFDNEHYAKVHTFVKAVSGVATRYAPSRVLSFSEVHVFKALQLMQQKRRVSRVLLCKELAVGEGTIKTLIKHMKMDGLIATTNGGTHMTAKGKAISEGLTSTIPAETSLPKCSVALGKFNHAVLVKSISYVIKSGIEQRDAAIKMNATGATTLLCKDKKLVMPTNMNQNSLKNEPEIRKLLFEKLKPEQEDVIIIGSSDNNSRTAELAAKYAALSTLLSHEKHS